MAWEGLGSPREKQRRALGDSPVAPRAEESELLLKAVAAAPGGAARADAQGAPSAGSPGLGDPGLDFDPAALGVADLSAWMVFFGLKAAGSREYMVRRLREIAAYLRAGAAEPTATAAAALQEAGPARSEGVPPHTPTKRAAPSDVGEAGPVARAAKRARGELSAQLALSAEERAAKLQAMLAEAIRGDTELYEQLLLFEPLEIRDLKERLAAARPELRRLGLSEKALRSFLDGQGLLFAATWSPGHRKASRAFFDRSQPG